ncbi:MAG: hypothetical protein HJJLKODD_01646 [Phycisphaerae bacterium]|nr:hypothetical protein [Phycisphaerae bacterium]
MDPQAWVERCASGSAVGVLPAVGSFLHLLTTLIVNNQLPDQGVSDKQAGILKFTRAVFKITK